MASSQYNEHSITVLEGLEPVRKRPGMYIPGIDTAGYHHLLWEILDNAVDEVINGFATTIKVTLHADGRSVTVEDNGRGIPTGVMPKYNKSALEVILTTLHAGGKFDQGNYIHSGGLHGVGSSVVNALSEELVYRVRRDGEEVEQRYSRGLPTTKLKKLGPARGTGTRVFFRPDPEIFIAGTRFDVPLILERLEAKTYLHQGLRILVTDEATGQKEDYAHQGGIADYLQKIVAERQKPAIVGVPPLYLNTERDQSGLRFELAFCWTEATDEHIKSYVNSIPTPFGGTHEAGLRAGVVKGVRNFIETHNLSPKGVSLTAEDIREGLLAILSCYLLEPQFQSQSKVKLNNVAVTAEIDGAVRNFIEGWLNNNTSAGEAIIARIVAAARAREASRAASQAVSRKTAVSHRLNLPGKLADCSSTDPTDSELFIVEGDSAGGSAKQGRNRKTQAILPLRGKVLNAEQASTSKLLANKELQDIVSALGCGFGKDFDETKLRYGKIFLLMDADSDGYHISTLLLTFFYRHLPKLIENGHVFLAQPPLYRVDAGKETHWVVDDDAKDQLLKRLPKNVKPEIQRFKGLGEMMPQQLWETTLDPKRRSALKITITGPLETDRVLNELMGKDPAARYRFIMEHAREARELDV